MNATRFIPLLGLMLALSACDKPTQPPAAASAPAADASAPAAQQTSAYPALSTEQLLAKRQDANTLIIDTRSSDAFNGWTDEGATRGGHLHGAENFSAQWLSVDAKDKEQHLQKVLAEKGITPDKQLVLYDANGKDAKTVADWLSKQGFKNIATYDIKQWAADPAQTLDSYANYQIVVPAHWVKDVIDGKTTQAYDGNKKIKLFQVGWGPKAEKMQPNFIPGAARMNTDDFEEGPIWNRLSDDRLKAALLKYGISHDSLVVLYGVEGADLMAAYRMYAILKYMGVKDVRVLNGGFAKWQQAGYPAVEKGAALQAVSDFGVATPAGKANIIDMPQAKQLLQDKTGSRLVDIRTLDEFTGKIPGYSDITAKGRIPGSYWGQAGTDTSNLNDYRNIDQTMKNGANIITMWQSHGITPDKRLSFYCGTGWRAAEVLAYANVIGIKDASLYDGGWYEWSADKKNPTESGLPPEMKNAK